MVVASELRAIPLQIHYTRDAVSGLPNASIQTKQIMVLNHPSERE